MNRDFLRDLKLKRRRHQVRRNWKGAKGREEMSSRIWIWNVRQGRCSHSILERSKIWLGCSISSWSSNDFHLDHPNRGKGYDFQHLRVSISSTRMLEKMTWGDHPWCRNIKYWEVNSIVHSLVDSQFNSLSFHCEIDDVSWASIFASKIQTQVWLT